MSVAIRGRFDLGLALVVGLSATGCGSGQSSPDGGQSSLPPLPRGSDVAPVEVPLTASTITDFISFAGRSGRQEVPFIRSELEKARSDAAIVDGMLAALSASWRYENGGHVVGDVSIVVVTFELVKHLRSARASAVLEGMVWRPIPAVGAADPFSVIEALEMSAVEALACIADGTAQAAITKIVNSHPSKGVRDAAANQVANQYCKFDQTYYNP